MISFWTKIFLIKTLGFFKLFKIVTFYDFITFKLILLYMINVSFIYCFRNASKSNNGTYSHQNL